MGAWENRGREAAGQERAGNGKGRKWEFSEDRNHLLSNILAESDSTNSHGMPRIFVF